MIVDFGKDLMDFYALDSGDVLVSFKYYTPEQLLYLIKCIEARIREMKKEDMPNLIKEMLKEYGVYIICPTPINNGKKCKFLDKCYKDSCLSLTKMFQDMKSRGELK